MASFFAIRDSQAIANRAGGIAIGLAMTLSCLIGVGYRLPWMRRGLGQDELFTAVHFVEVPSIRQTLFQNLAFNNHVLYSAMAVVSEKIFGHSEWALRIPALVLGVATIWVIFVVSRDLIGPWAALLASLALTLSPAHIVWSVQARGYSGLIFFTLLSSYFYFRLWRSPDPRIALYFVVTSVLSVYVHLYGSCVVAVQALLAVRSYWTAPKARGVPRSAGLLAASFFAIGTVSIALYVPMLRELIRDAQTRGHSDFDPAFPWSVLQLLSGTDQPLVILLMLTVGVIGVVSLLRSHGEHVKYFVALLGLPLLLMWLLVRPFDLYARLFAYFLPVYLILVVAGLQAMWKMIPMAHQQRRTWDLRRVVVALVIAAIATDWIAGVPRRIPNEGYREVSQAVLTAEPSAAFCAIGGARSVWQYYIKRPLLTPQSLEDFLAIASRHAEVRCVYYQATWESAEQTSIARFLMRNASWANVNQSLYWFIYPGRSHANLSG